MSLPSGALLTDLYQLTMLQAYVDEGMADELAVFEFYVRSLPTDRNFLVAAGLAQVLDYVETLTFSNADITWLAAQGRFSPDFLAWLASWRFAGDIDAMPEGTLFFPNEPILRVTAPMAQAQFIESRVINLLHLQTIIASKAVRCVLAAPGKLLVDFGLRRAHGAEAGLLAARACYLAGFAGSATVQAGVEFGLPVFGTMAHSYVQAHASEVEAFRQFARVQPDNVVLLIDTYDTETAAHKVAALAPELRQQGIAIKAVRIDSGDLAAHAKAVRAILDAAGQTQIGIFASGNLDEYELQRLLAEGAPITGFGIGTRVDTASDAPYLDCAYKLQEYAGIPRRKRSAGKATWPGRKQVYRRYLDNGQFAGDTIALVPEAPVGEPLLKPYLRQGCPVLPADDLIAIRARVAAQLAHLPPLLRALAPVAEAYPVTISAALRALAETVDARPH